jgi:hypothetical protein
LCSDWTSLEVGSQSKARYNVEIADEHLLRSRSGVLASLDGVALHARTAGITSITPQLEALTLGYD